MSESRDLSVVIDSAEREAAAGNYASAERLLREAAVLQEASLGPQHPDLANTLNNLGIVCEVLEQPGDAEACFRRAYQIASAALDPDHPFVATSRQNLEDFCRARGILLDGPRLPAAEAGAPERDDALTPATPPAVSPVSGAASPSESGGAARESTRTHRASRPAPRWAMAIGTVIAIALVAALAVLARRPPTLRDEPTGRAIGLPGKAAQEAPQNPLDPARQGASAEPPPAAAVPPPPAGKEGPRAAMPGAGAAGGPLATSTPPTGLAPARQPRVVDARVCARLSTGAGEWACTPPTQPASPGVLAFYSRLASPVDTSVVHRWYHGDQLRQAVELEIRANTASGYRTFSRYRIGPDGAGDWRVEIRSPGGSLLHEERFVVR
jgi:hypothetical protein